MGMTIQRLGIFHRLWDFTRYCCWFNHRISTIIAKEHIWTYIYMFIWFFAKNGTCSFCFYVCPLFSLFEAWFNLATPAVNISAVLEDAPIRTPKCNAGDSPKSWAFMGQMEISCGPWVSPVTSRGRESWWFFEGCQARCKLLNVTLGQFSMWNYRY
jgi:hypothetical protein